MDNLRPARILNYHPEFRLEGDLTVCDLALGGRVVATARGPNRRCALDMAADVLDATWELELEETGNE